MSAGISPQRAYRIVRRELHKIERELREAGVPCHYYRSAVSNGAARLPVEEPSLLRAPSDTFEVFYSHGHMSNGESVISGLIFVHPVGKEKPETYGWQDWAKGMERIKTLFGVHSTAGVSA